MTRHTVCALALAGAALLGGCAADDAELILPETEPADEIFDRYAALGNSITAGYQSGGINDSTQLQAYPVLVAAQANAPFGVPLLNRPGCPPPLAAPFSSTRVGTVPGGCALRAVPTGPIQNLAVPGARVATGTSNLVAANALTTFILGGRSQAEAMDSLNPTLVSVWLGNNEILDAALTGNPALLLPVADFTASLDALVAEIEEEPAARNDAVVLFGVVNASIVPALQPGAFAFLVKSDPSTAPLLPKSVSPTCSPVTAQGQPNPLARNLISLGVLSSPAPEITCVNTPNAIDFVLTAEEQTAISARVAAYNQAIQTRASAKGWIYIDPNALLVPFLADNSAIRKCAGLATARTTAEIGAAVAATCPSPTPSVGFGSLFSFDGVNPSARAHRILANEMIRRLNAKFSLSVPLLSL